ncbi:MAG TPA: alpha/beta hydrolase [Terriglobia bacterium]|nr:alpha/beta hydrolase [Terriglobia bacterium]
MQKLSVREVSLAALLSYVMLVGLAVQAQSPAATDAGKPVATNMASPAVHVPSEITTPRTTEDLSTPSLTGSRMEVGEPLVGEVDQHPGYTRELTRVQWRGGDPIDLYIVKPQGVEKPPVILYLYSYPFELDRFQDEAFCRFLTKDGFAAIAFPSALTADRYHGVPMKKWFVSELQFSLAATAHDVQLLLNYLATRGDMDMNRVGAFGDGSGATIAILAAAADPRIKTLDLLDPWGDWPDWVAKSTLIPENERADYLKPEWLKGVAPLDPIKWLPELKQQTVRIQMIGSVTVTPEDVKKKLKAVAPPNAEIVHYADSKAFKNTVANGTGFDWLKQHVQPGTAASQANGDLRSSSSTAFAKDLRH